VLIDEINIPPNASSARRLRAGGDSNLLGKPRARFVVARWTDARARADPFEHTAQVQANRRLAEKS
jgi:hypothetical protein